MHANDPKNPWILFRHPRPQALLRLFCFPYAGGGASIFRSWSTQLPAEIDVCPVQLPGRETRLLETPICSLTSLVELLAPALLPYLDLPYVFFGHSMGALISFELTHALSQRGHRLPARLLLSGHRAPHIPPLRSSTYHLPQDDFISELRSLQGTPEEILQNKELLELLLPLLRADFELCDTYQYSQKKRLEIPISAFGGLQDHEVPRNALEAWKECTLKDFTLRFFNGGHFFLQHEQEALLSVIAKDLLSRTVLK